MFGADHPATTPSANPAAKLVVPAALVLVVTGVACAVTPATFAFATPVGLPIAFLIGVYFAFCSTFAQEFPLYAMKAARGVAAYGEEQAHGAYRLLGCACVGFSIWGTYTVLT